jgi:hypothetical protein
MSNSKLITYTKLSPNYSSRNGKKIKKITIHHAAGKLTVKQIGNIFASKARGASSNYGVDGNGDIALYVPEKYRAWTSSSADNDCQAVTIEVANDGGAPNWHVSNKALEATIDLCVDICERNDIDRLNYNGKKSGNLTRHNMFAATACPGPYLQSKFEYIEDEVNRRLAEREEYRHPNHSFPVQVKVNKLFIRTGAGIKYKKVGAITDKGVYTIVKTVGSWGKLKSGKGWINISSKYCKRI